VVIITSEMELSRITLVTRGFVYDLLGDIFRSIFFKCKEMFQNYKCIYFNKSNKFSKRFSAHDSRLTTHDSRLTTHDSRLTANGKLFFPPCVVCPASCTLI